MRDNTNKFVNNKDFGVIAKSSRGSNTPTQIGDMNQRERYNQDRDNERKIILSNRKHGGVYKDSVGGTTASGSGGKLTAADVKASEKKYKYSESTGARKSQRKGGSGK
jgi:hypothetical protein